MNMILHGHETAELWRGNTLAARISRILATTSRPSTSQSPTLLSPTRHGLADSIRPTTSTGASSTASHLPGMETMPFSCTSSLRSRARARARSFCRMACCFAATGGRHSQEPRQARPHQGHHRPAPNLFYGTGIPACILVIDKENANTRTGIFMIDAGKASARTVTRTVCERRTSTG